MMSVTSTAQSTMCSNKSRPKSAAHQLSFLQQLEAIASLSSRQRIQADRRGTRLLSVLPSDVAACQLSTAHIPNLQNCTTEAHVAHIKHRLSLSGLSSAFAKVFGSAAVLPEGGSSYGNASSAASRHCETQPVSVDSCIGHNLLILPISPLVQTLSATVARGSTYCSCNARNLPSAKKPAAAESRTATSCFKTLLVATSPSGTRQHENTITGILNAVRELTAAPLPPKLHITAFGSAGLALKAALLSRHSQNYQAKLKQTIASVTFIAVPHLGSPCADVASLSPWVLARSVPSLTTVATTAAASLLSPPSQDILQAAGLSRDWCIANQCKHPMSCSPSVLAERIFVVALSNASSDTSTTTAAGAAAEVAAQQQAHQVTHAHQYSGARKNLQTVFQRTFEEWFTEDCHPLAQIHDGLVSLPSALGLPGARVVCPDDGTAACAGAVAGAADTSDPCSVSLSPQWRSMPPCASTGHRAQGQLAFSCSHEDFLHSMLAIAAPRDRNYTPSDHQSTRALRVVHSCFAVAHASVTVRRSSRPPRPRSPLHLQQRPRSRSITATALGLMSEAASTAVSGLRRTASFFSVSSAESELEKDEAHPAGSSHTVQAASKAMYVSPRVETGLFNRDTSFGTQDSSTFSNFGGSPCSVEFEPDSFPLSGHPAPEGMFSTPVHDPERRCMSGPAVSLGSAATQESTNESPRCTSPLRTKRAVLQKPQMLCGLLALCLAVAMQQLLQSESGKDMAVGVFASVAYASAMLWSPLRHHALRLAQASLLQPVLWLDGGMRSKMSRLQRSTGHVAELSHGVVFFSSEKVGSALIPRNSHQATSALFPHVHTPGMWQAGLTGHAACSTVQPQPTGQSPLPQSLLALVQAPAAHIPPTAWNSAQALAGFLLQRVATTFGGQVESADAAAAYMQQVPELCASISASQGTDELQLVQLHGTLQQALAQAMPAASSPAVLDSALRGVFLPLALLFRSMKRSSVLRGPLPVTSELLAEVQRLFPPLPWLKSSAPHAMQVRLTRGRSLHIRAGAPIWLYAETSNRDPVEFGGQYSSSLHAGTPAWALPEAQRTHRGVPLGCIAACNTSLTSLPFDATAVRLRSLPSDSLADRVLEVDDRSWALWGWACAVAVVWLWAARWTTSSRMIQDEARQSHAWVLKYLAYNAASAMAWCALGREASLAWGILQLAGTGCLCVAASNALSARGTSLEDMPPPLAGPRERSRTDNPVEGGTLSSSDRKATAHSTHDAISPLHLSEGVSLSNRSSRSVSVSSGGSVQCWDEGEDAFSTAEPVSAAGLEVLFTSKLPHPSARIRRPSFADLPSMVPGQRTESWPLQRATPHPVERATPPSELFKLCLAVVGLLTVLWFVSPGADLHPLVTAGQLCMLALSLGEHQAPLRSLVVLPNAQPQWLKTAIPVICMLLVVLPLVVLQGRSFYVLSNVISCSVWLPVLAACARSMQSSAATKPDSDPQTRACRTPIAAAMVWCSSPLLPLYLAGLCMLLAAAVSVGGAVFLHRTGLCNWSAHTAAAVSVGGAVLTPPFACPNCPGPPPQANPPQLMPGVCDGSMDGLLQRLDLHTRIMYHMLTLQNDVPLPPPSGTDVGPPQWHQPLRRTPTAIGVPVVSEDEDDAVSAIPYFVNNAALQVLRARELFSDAHVADDVAQFESVEQARGFLNAAGRGGARLPAPLVSHSDLLSDTGLSKIAFNGLGAHMIAAAKPEQREQLAQLPGASSRLALSDIMYISDLRQLASLETRHSFARMGACAVFDSNGTAVGIILNDAPHARRVEEGAWVFPGDLMWPRAKFVWRSSLVVGVTVLDHLTGSHMVANTVNAAVRESLPTAHPVRRLLRPGDYMSVWINQGAIPTLLSQNDVLHRTLPFTRAGQLRGIRQALQASQWTSVQQDLHARGMHTAPAWLYPYGSDLAEFTAVVQRFVEAYLHVYYPDESISGDTALMAWLQQLESSFPSVPVGTRDFPGVVQTVTTVIVHESQHHMQVGRVTSYVTDPALAAAKLTTSNMADVQSAMQMFLVASVTNRARPMLMANYDHLVSKRHHAKYYAAVGAWGEFRKELCALAHSIDVANSLAQEDAVALGIAGGSFSEEGDQTERVQKSAAQRRWPTNGANPRLMAAGVSI